ncbi:MAG: hypothetical protein JXD22_12645 [Sedimentisphaerales bacterium]|nr:hypothetical protein [Sedimentisphaerales bacterium]
MHHSKTIVHITHETTHKIGGIGAVLEGLLTAESYRNEVGRSVLLGPLFKGQHVAEQRLGPDGQVLYSSLDGITDHPYKLVFKDVERKFGVSVVYGYRTFYQPGGSNAVDVEVILIDTDEVNPNPVNALKAWLFDDFGIESLGFESDPEYDQYVKLAPAALALLRGINVSDPNQPAVLISHEYMGMPTILAAILDPLGTFKTMYYAHEVPSVRRIIENHPGHDTMFYNTLRWTNKRQYYLADIFGPQDSSFRHALTCASRYCDNIVAVGDQVKNELRFLSLDFNHVSIDLAYNGIETQEISLESKLASKNKLQQYAQNLLGYRPDYIFTHVARTTISKGFWRDFRVLEHLDKQFQKDNQTGILFLLSTDASARSPEEIREMETAWDWPVAHKQGYPDLCGAEIDFYPALQSFNARSHNIKAVLVNQFGWDSRICGSRMPREMTFKDLREGCDVEFGQSAYEPFGIAQLEPLGYGAICVTSNVCGCCGFVEQLCDEELPANIVKADYVQADLNWSKIDIQNLLSINQQFRDRIEMAVSAEVAHDILQRLPKNDDQAEALIRSGYEIAHQMTWEKVSKSYFLPALDRAYRRFRTRQIA